MPLPTIVSGNVASATASTTYDVANSCRFDAASDAYMHKTPGSAGNTGLKKFTFSTWVKRAGIATEQTLIRTKDGSNVECKIGFDASGELRLYRVGAILVTNAKYRDPSAWMHVVFAVDTTQASSSNRLKLYVNGTQVTSFSTETQPSADTDMKMCGDTLHIVGGVWTDDRGGDMDGYLAETVLIDGTQYAASDFGEFDEDSPTIWKPKKVSGLTFGTNGFYLDYEASDNLGNDANGGTDLTESGLAAIDQCSDSPTNNFCTWNSASEYGGAFSEGNTKSTGTGHYNPMGTFGMAKGKWYWECYLSGSHITCGVAESGITPTNAASQSSYPFWLIYDNGGATYKYPNPTSGDNITAVTSLGNFADGVTIGLAFDADAKKLWAHFNGTYYDGGSGTGDPAAGSNELLGSVEPQFGGTIVPACGVGTSNSEKSINVNFGNPSVSISSGNTDANNYGNFEFEVPSGFFALCTKNLAEYG